MLKMLCDHLNLDRKVVVKENPFSEVTVQDLMTPSPMCVGLDTSVMELCDLLAANHFDHALVKDDEGKLVGILSDRDILRHFGPRDKKSQLKATMVADIMTENPITITENSSVQDAALKMRKKGIHCLPVVLNGHPVGVLSTSDLLALLEQVLMPS